MHNHFSNVCLIAIICLLAVIILRLDSGEVHASKKHRYQVVRVLEAQASDVITKQVDDGWELVAAPFYAYANTTGNASGLLIFRK